MKNPIRILFTAPHLDGGGSERVLLNLLNSIDRDQIEPELLIFEKHGSLMELLKPDIRLVPNKVRRPRYALFEIAKILRKNKYDAVFVMKHYMFFIVFLALRLSGVRTPIIYREITHVSTELRRNFTGFSMQRLYNNRCLYGFLYRHMSAIIAPSQEIKRDLIKSFGVKEEKISVIYNPVNVSEIERSCAEGVSHPWFQGDTPVIISAGRLVRQKNFQLLLEAFKLVADSGRKARLVIMGKGELKAGLLNMIESMGLSEIAMILEHQKNPFKYISKADIYAASSLWEGFPNSLLEAMACETAVVSTDCPSGPSEMIENGVDGLLVASGNSIQLYEALASLLDDEKMRSNLIEAGKKKVSDKYDIERIIPLYMNMLLKVNSIAG